MLDYHAESVRDDSTLLATYIKPFNKNKNSEMSDVVICLQWSENVFARSCERESGFLRGLSQYEVSGLISFV